tara:strand:+ start:1022 stop:2404 length:1383 start_codon:yes stop_codon:yes gene_type:complete
MSSKAILSVVVTVAVIAATIIGFRWYSQQSDIPEVDVERITRRHLEAIVSASGTIEPELSVDISSSVMGRVTRLAVNEGDRVTAGQFLLEIDPENLQAAVDRGEASLQATRSGLDQARVATETARVNLELAQDNLKRQQELWELRLISREVYDQARADVELRETELESRQVEISTARQRIRQESATLDSAQYDLSQVTITSPINGLVTRRNIEEGETVVIGTMNNAGTVLLTIADFSIMEAHVEVDETDIPSVTLNQAGKITIDALPEQAHYGFVTEIGNSPIQDTSTGSSQAINFKVVVTLNDDVPNVRPGFTATADITTATRTNAIAVPIQATTVREIPLRQDQLGGTSLSANGQQLVDSFEEIEGAFVVRDGRVSFVQIETGIAGERYFEVLSGLDENDLVVTGPFDVVRTLKDGDLITYDAQVSSRNLGDQSGPANRTGPLGGALGAVTGRRGPPR